MERVIAGRGGGRRREAFSTVTGPVSSGGEPASAKVLAGLWDVDPSLARALTHGFHAYAGRMHPSLARGAIAHWTEAGDVVLDSFCGSGTVPVEAMIAGRRARARDLSPLAVAIARVRTNPLGAAKRARLVEEANAIAEASAERARGRQKPTLPVWSRPERERFAPHVLLELLGLRELVMATADDDVGQALRLAMSSILVKFQRAGGAEAPPGAEAQRIGRGIPSFFFGRRVEELARGLEALERATPPGTAPVDLDVGDARKLAGVGGRSVKLVVSSPPYAGVYDYGRHHDSRFAWLGVPRRRFDRDQLGPRREEGSRGAEAWETWRSARRAWLAEMFRVLAPGGHAVLVVGDGIIAGQAEDAAEATWEAGLAVGFEPLAWASQDRHPGHGAMARAFAGRPRREHIVLLSRP